MPHFKKLLFYYFIIQIYGCLDYKSNTPKMLSIKGEIYNLNSGIVYLDLLFPMPISYKNIDSSILKKGKFDFNIELNEPTIALISYKANNGTNKKILTNSFWVENGKILIKVFKNGDSKITGSTTQDEFLLYQNFWNPPIILSRLYIKKSIFIKNHDKENVYNIQHQIDSVKNQKNIAIRQLIIKNSNSFYLLFGIIQSKSNYKIEDLKEIISSFSDEILKTKSGQSLQNYVIRRSNLEINKPIPNVKVYDTAFNTFKLKNLLLKYTLIDFWATWCIPCMEQIPTLYKLHNEYKKYGFQVLPISIDDNKEYWKLHVSNAKKSWTDLIADSSVKQTFCLDFIPNNYLIDQNGKIIQKNISLNELEKILKNLKMK